MYCWPANLKSGILPSEVPHAYVIEYHVIGPGMKSAAMPPAWLSLETTRYFPSVWQLAVACAKHFAGSDVHLTVLIAVPSGARYSVMLVVAQPVKATRRRIEVWFFMCVA
jgi:hypothetical protein